MRSAFRVIRTVREKHACTQCDAIVQAPAPSRPIERGIAGQSLLARIVMAKFVEHTPHYRQSEIYRRQGVDLSRSLLYSLIGTCELNGVDPESYLRHALDVIADWPVNKVSELLPWRVALPTEYHIPVNTVLAGLLQLLSYAPVLCKPPCTGYG